MDTQAPATRRMPAWATSVMPTLAGALLLSVALLTPQPTSGLFFHKFRQYAPSPYTAHRYHWFVPPPPGGSTRYATHRYNPAIHRRMMNFADSPPSPTAASSVASAVSLRPYNYLGEASNDNTSIKVQLHSGAAGVPSRPVSNQASMERLVQLASYFDKRGCFPRLVCEAEYYNNDTDSAPTVAERLVLKVYGMHSGRKKYRQAALMGSNARDLGTEYPCANASATCTRQLVQQLRKQHK